MLSKFKDPNWRDLVSSAVAAGLIVLLVTKALTFLTGLVPDSPSSLIDPALSWINYKFVPWINQPIPIPAWLFWGGFFFVTWLLANSGRGVPAQDQSDRSDVTTAQVATDTSMHVSLKSEWLEYTSDYLDGLAWNWAWDEAGFIKNLIPLCPDCGLQMAVFSLIRSAENFTVFNCEECDKRSDEYPGTPSGYTDLLKRRIEKSVRMDTWRGNPETP